MKRFVRFPLVALALFATACSATESIRPVIDVRATVDPQSDRLAFVYAAENTDRVMAGGHAWVDARLVERSIGFPIFQHQLGGGVLWIRDKDAGLDWSGSYPEDGPLLVPDALAAVAFDLCPAWLRFYDASADRWSAPSLGLVWTAGIIPPPVLP